MYLITRRGALAALESACQLAGEAAVACVRGYEQDARFEEAFARWRPRPRKVVLRARGGQWDQALADVHALAGDSAGEAVIALPPRRASQRSELLGRMQALTTDLGPAPAGDHVDSDPGAPTLTFLLNPAVDMSSGKTLAQVAHAAVMAADRPDLEDWVRDGCRARVRIPDRVRFAQLGRSSETVARVIDAGLTEVAPGTVTVLALPTVPPGA